jgi:very-short-patch-repair endonuclease
MPTTPTHHAALLRAGVTEAMIETQVRSGRLLRLRHAVYLARSAWPEDRNTAHLLLARAELAALPDGVLSHQSAAVSWNLPHPGFERWSEHPPAITLPMGSGHRSKHGCVHHHVALLPDDQVSTDPAGFAVTGIARTAIDLAAGLPLPEALVIVDGAARALCTGYLAIARRSDYLNPRLANTARQTLLDTARRRRRTGLAPVIALADPSRESAAESLSAGHFHLAGLPTPRFQATVKTGMGTFFPDCLWSEYGVIGECDGTVKYADPQAYAHEKTREQVLRDLGYQFVRWQAKEIMITPEAVVARVARALGL